MPNEHFDAVREAARKIWNDNLSRIQIEASNPDIRQTFYSCLYHSMIAPQSCNNADDTYRGTDKQVHSSKFSGLFDLFHVGHLPRGSAAC